MKLLVVHPGADWSTSDVFDGYTDAFRRLGHEVGTYNLHVRLGRAERWLDWNWRKAGKPEPRPTGGDTIYLASADAVLAALRSDADWVLIITGAYLHPDAVVMLRRAGRRVALMLTESPYEDDQQAQLASIAHVVFTNERTSVATLRQHNPNVVYLPPAYDPVRHRPVPLRAEPIVPTHDVVFVGTGFAERLEALAAVDWDGIDLGLYGDYSLLGSRSRLRRYVRGGIIDNTITSALYRRAKVGLNLYRSSLWYRRDSHRILGAESVNPRAVELAACGVFTISDRRAAVTESFGELVPTFTRADELEPLLRRWLEDDEGRRQVAQLLPSRVVNSTFDRRAAQVADLLEHVGGRIGTAGSRAAATLGRRDGCEVVA